MQIGLHGLGRVGSGMARRLARGGRPPAAWNVTPELDPAAALARDPALAGFTGHGEAP